AVVSRQRQWRRRANEGEERQREGAHSTQLDRRKKTDEWREARRANNSIEDITLEVPFHTRSVVVSVRRATVFCLGKGRGTTPDPPPGWWCSKRSGRWLNCRHPRHIMSFYEKRYGTTLKGGVAARIEHVSRFLNWSWWFYITPRCRSSVFYRVGFHVKCWLFLGMGLFCFFVEVFVIYRYSTYFTKSLVDYSSRIHKEHVNLSMRIISFVLSAYVIMLVKVYHTGTRRKARDMMYGCSNAVDTLSVCLNYDHPSAKKLLPGLHSAMTVIGQYALAQAAKKTREFKLSQDEMIDLFHRKDLDGAYLTKITPKQCLHVLRLAILQSVASERKENGCLSLMTHSDWKTFRRDLNDYSGGASQTISALSSSKLPYAYFQVCGVVEDQTFQLSY
ncbi:hypothetical protein ACHAWF_012092, partial [Thalassiosira exigua]